jgi:nitroreductase
VLVSASSVLGVIKARGSIRSYEGKPIHKQALLDILEAARMAQSAANRQPWEFIVVTDPAIKKKLIQAAGNQSFVGEAAAVIVCLANPEESASVGPFEGFLIDLAIAIENMVLTAWDLGIGSCWIGAYNERKVKELLDVPRNLRVVSLLTLGYPDERAGPKYRKDLDEIVHYQKYGQKEN